jgi:conjugal transfer pilus assembly protein TraB
MGLSMDKTSIKSALQGHWENPKVRFGAIAVVLLTVTSFIAFNTEDMNTGGTEGPAVGVEKKKKVEANFFTQAGADDIDQGRMDEIYDLMEEQLAEREKAIDDREEEMRMMEGRLLQELESLKFAHNDLKRELEIQKTASDEIRKQTAPVQNPFAPPATTVAPTQQQAQQPVAPKVPMAKAVQNMMPRVIDRKRVGIRTINGQGDHFKDSQGKVIDQTPEYKKPKEKEVVREEPQKEEPKKPVEMFLPAGSILSGVLISGMDVPTGNSVMRDPFPSILRIKKEALLPNNFTADIRECVIVASAVGDLASRRAYLRAEAISCVTDQGKAVEANLSAYAVGPDGRNGIPGRLVSQNGEAAMKSAWAGFLGGISDLAGKSSLNIGENETGAFGVFQSAEAMQTITGSAALQGAGEAMERLADYYIEIAEQMKPYIEINPGQSIDFIIQRGSSLRLE